MNSKRKRTLKPTSLTAKRVAKLIRRGEPGRFLDTIGRSVGGGPDREPCRGLYLVVGGKHAAHWELRFQLNHRTRFMGLGSARVFNLGAARRRAREAREQLADKIDPLEARRAEQRTAKAVKAAEIDKPTFKVAAQKYCQLQQAGWKNAKHGAQFMATLALYAFPVLGALKIDEIDTAKVLRVLQQEVPAERGYPAGTLWTARTETASRVRNRIERILDWATVSGYRSGDNPARWTGYLEGILPSRNSVAKVVHHSALAYREVPAFFAELRAREGTAAQALQFTILTAARTNEVMGAKWAEIDFDEAIWTIPAGRMKAAKEHRVPLAPAALDLLRSLYSEDGNEHIFIGLRRDGLSNAAMAAVLKRMGFDATVHGFRSSFRDWCAETTATPNHVVEQALAHSIGNAVEAAYRRGDLFNKRKTLMTAWARYCTTPRASAGATVVPLREVRP
jgi:integrase